MTNRIEINVEEALQYVTALENAIAEFEPFTASFTRNAVHRFHGFNADFIEQLKDLLDNMADNTGPELLQEIKNYSQKMRFAIETVKEMDEILEQGIGSE